MIFYFRSQGYEIKWVDDTHALAVFSSEIAGTKCIIDKLVYCIWIMSAPSGKDIDLLQVESLRFNL